jgi:galactose mutarotase-like enzyme
MELSITQEDAGHTAEGLPLFIFALCNRHGMEVRISTLGGAIARIQVPDRNGRLANVVHGATPDCGIHLQPAPGRALHRMPWHAVPLVEDASVGLRLVSPGPQAVVATYVLDEANGLSLQCQALAAAPATICLRTAFNLAGEGEVLGQLLTVGAARIVPAGEHGQDVAGTPWDFRDPRRLAELPGQARYVLGEDQRVGLALRLLDPASGRVLEVASDGASLRLGLGAAAACLWLEPVLPAAGGSISLRFGAQG